MTAGPAATQPNGPEPWFAAEGGAGACSIPASVDRGLRRNPIVRAPGPASSQCHGSDSRGWLLLTRDAVVRDRDRGPATALDVIACSMDRLPGGRARWSNVRLSESTDSTSPSSSWSTTRQIRPHSASSRFSVREPSSTISFAVSRRWRGEPRPNIARCQGCSAVPRASGLSKRRAISVAERASEWTRSGTSA